MTEKASPINEPSASTTPPIPRGVRRLRGGRVALAAGGAALIALLALAYGLSPSTPREREASQVKIDLRKTRGDTGSPPGLSLPNGLDYATATKPPSPLRREPARTGYAALTSSREADAADPSPTEDDAEALAVLAGLQQQNAELQQRLVDYEVALANELDAAEQRQQERQASREAPIGFASIKPSAPASSTGPSTADINPRRGEDRSIAARSHAHPAVDLEPLAEQPMRENLQREKIAFLNNAERELATYLPTGPTGPVLPQFELAAGSVVPGFTVTGINTDLPGKVVGRVSSDVYDSATGRHVLIPQGSVAVGDYSSLVSNGQNRVLIAWEMLTFPDGRSIDLRRQPGVDAEGFAGLNDKVDYHWKELFLAGGLSTAVAIGGELAEGENSGFDRSEDVGEQLRELVFGGANDTSSRIANKIIDRQLDVQPTITVRPGWRFNILLTRNLVLEPYIDSRR